MHAAGLVWAVQSALDERLLPQNMWNGCAASSNIPELLETGILRTLLEIMDARPLYEILRKLWLWQLSYNLRTNSSASTYSSATYKAIS